MAFASLLCLVELTGHPQRGCMHAVIKVEHFALCRYAPPGARLRVPCRGHSVVASPRITTEGESQADTGLVVSLLSAPAFGADYTPWPDRGW
jgi:hypothetical protein